MCVYVQRGFDDRLIASATAQVTLQITLNHCHIWVGFEDVADEAGNGLTWNDETRDRMLSTSYIRLALLRTYTAALVKVKAGN